MSGPRARTLLTLSALLGLAAASHACTGTCPKDKLEAGAAFIRDVCALQRFHSLIYLREGAAWARVDPAATPLPDGIPVSLYADAVAVDHQLIPAPGLDALHAWIVDEVDKAEHLARTQDRPWSRRGLLAIAADVPVESIPPVLDLFYKTGFTEVALLAEAGDGPAIPSLPAPEVRVEIAARAAAMPPDTFLPEMVALRQLVDVEGARCPPLARGLDHIASHSSEERCANLGRDVLAACEECRCSADVSRALSLAMTPMLPAVLTVERRAAEDAPPVLARAGERWADVAPRVFAAPGPAVRLQVEPGG